METQNNYRYMISITFKRNIFSDKRIENISEQVKTIKEARSYKVLIDDTVAKACIFDRVTNKVVEWWL